MRIPVRLRRRIRGFLPTTLRARLLLIFVLVVSVPLGATSYVLDAQGRAARTEEKVAKLFGLARILDGNLRGGYDQLLADYHGDPADRAAKIAFLNGKLRDFTDIVADSSPGVGVGYYDLALNAIVTYGPSGDYGNTVGQTIAADHPGWGVLHSGRPAVGTGPQVRGSIMNAMWPIVREDKVIGYIWANELTGAIDSQLRAMDRVIAGVTVFAIVLGLVLAHAISTRLSRDIAEVTNGLKRIQFDLARPIRCPPGEIGEIATAVNALARALLDARSTNENILNSIGDGVIAIDVNRRLTSINPAAQRMLGVRAEDVLGRPYETLYERDQRFVSALLDTLESGREHIGVSLVWPTPEQTISVSATSSLLRDGSGAAIGAVVVLTDVSEQRRLQKQIMRADRLAALGELMAGVAHEIRNPLTSVRGFMQYVEGCNSLEEWQQYAPLIIRQVDSLNRIIGELLEFGRQHPPFVGPARLNDLIREITVLAGRDSMARIVLELAPDMPVVEADGEELKQVVLNLVINAIQAVEAAGTVTITIATATDGEGGAIVTVADDGIGIPPENLDKVFDPFFSTKPAGTGLGLAMAHRIMDAHNGTITIDSAPGRGTKVTLRLPLVHTPVQVLA